MSEAIFEQAESRLQEGSVFTNCGEAEGGKTRVKSAKRKLTRVPFTVSRLMEFCTRRELVNQTGHDVYDWPLVILKELVDNALDAAEEAEIAPAISIAVSDPLAADAIATPHDRPCASNPGRGRWARFTL
jgi:hypothetical protein